MTRGMLGGGGVKGGRVHREHSLMAFKFWERWKEYAASSTTHKSRMRRSTNQPAKQTIS